MAGGCLLIALPVVALQVHPGRGIWQSFSHQQDTNLSGLVPEQRSWPLGRPAFETDELGSDYGQPGTPG